MRLANAFTVLCSIVEHEPLFSDDDRGGTRCAMCDAPGEPGDRGGHKHKDDCPWLAAKTLIEDAK